MSRSTPNALTILIKGDTRAVISAFETTDPSDEIKLRVAAWLISDVARRLGVDEVEITYEPSQ